MSNQLRRTGRTTKLIDRYVHDYFTVGRCFCEDHYIPDKNGSFSERNEEISRMVLGRLFNEHGITNAQKDDNLLINPDFKIKP